MGEPPPVVVLVGPTAGGKTALLDELFGDPRRRLAYGLPEAEVICADSMQAYRGMDIGTAKPDAALRARLPHALIDILDASEQYTVGDFARLAEEACAEAGRRGRLPIVSGGTGFYVRGFLCGLPSAPAADPGMRRQVAADLERLGAQGLRAELEAADPASAARIHGNDLYRLTRALEIVRATGRPMADFAPGRGLRAGLRAAVLGLAPPPDELARRIGARVDAMMAAGLAEEVESLLAAGYGPGDPGMKAIGYREFVEARSLGSARAQAPSRFEGAVLEEIAERIKLDTRRYAKRQMTFFRALPGIEWIEAEPGRLAARVRSIVHEGRSEI
jgi:tRNA dimethylallyltransferase